MSQPSREFLAEPPMLPAHACGLYLEHNAHRDIYKSAAEAVAEDEISDWASEEAKQRAIATDEIWTLQWYPRTPIGFCKVAAPTLGELLELASREEQDGP